MITPEDADFHPRDADDRTWVETTALIFSVPEAGILGNAYVQARPNMGVAISSIAVGQGFCRQPYLIDFVDPQVHLPCPDNFLDFSLENGLTVKATNAPGDYRFTFEDQFGACRFDLDYRAVMQPFDAHDPSHNPLLGAGGQHSKRGDTWATGHYETKGHITGELYLRGTTYEVDCYEEMDHSWGPRAERGSVEQSWTHINFGDDFGAFVCTDITLRSDGSVQYDDARFGYILEDGEVHGIVHAKVESESTDLLGYANHIVLTDVRGKTFEFFGSAVAGHPWYSYNPNRVAFQSLFRYQYGNRIGYGEGGNIFGMNVLGERLSSHGRTPTITTLHH